MTEAEEELELLRAERDRARAKLARAVDALHRIANERNDRTGAIARAALAEIAKGVGDGSMAGG